MDGRGSIVSRALRYGVAIHHAALPEALRKAIERDFKSRLYQVIIATSTLAQGVNLPIKTVIMHSCMRANSDTNRMTSISATEYWNIAGRAGRAVEETEGLVIQLCFTPQDSRLFEHYIKRRFDLTPLHSSLASWLIDIIENRISSDELYRYLDADLLSHLVEEEVTDVTEEWVRSIFDSTFASATFRGDQEKLESCVLVLHQAFLDVTTRVPDHSRRVQYSSTGFSIESCEAIIDHITANEQLLRQVLVSNDPQEWRRTIPLFIAGCSNAWEVRIETNPTVDLALLADQWFLGTDYSSICSAFSLEATTKSYVSKLIEDFVSYRFAWGMSSYIRLCTANLAIDESELSDLARHFPSMMKYGVPNPQSVWCMNAGVPSRTIAMNLANGFIEDADPSTRHSLLSWLSKLSVEELRLRFHLDSVSLESTIDVVQRASPNLLVDLISRGDAVFPILTTVMLRSDLPAWINNSLKVGSLVEISRDYDLYISRNAVACFSGGELLGHSPTHIAQLIAPLMDSGQVFSATVTTTMSGLQNGRLSISIDKL